MRCALSSWPDRNGGPDDVLSAQRTEISTVKACRMLCEQQHLTPSKRTASLPGRQITPRRIIHQCSGGKSAPHKDFCSEPANTVACGRCGRLEQQGRSREVTAPIGKLRDCFWKAYERQLSEIRLAMQNSVKSDRYAWRHIPHNADRSVMKRWRDQERKRHTDAGHMDPHGLRPEDDWRRARSDQSSSSLRW
jgi:hypothetical protein